MEHKIEHKIEQNNIIAVAQNAVKIAQNPCACPKCGEKFFAPFDKLFVAAYCQCVDCTSEDELEEVSGNIFEIVEHCL